MQNNLHLRPVNPGVSLRQLVNQLMSDSLTNAIHNKTTIVNEVPADIRVVMAADEVGSVIGELLSTVILNSNKGNIRIKAERFRDVMVLYIQERNNNNGYALAYSLKSIEPRAAMIGGFLTIKDYQALETTISLSIPSGQYKPMYDC